MPTISVEKRDLCQLLGRDYTIEELEALMPLVKGELKSDAANPNDLKIELKDTNRPDLWCPEGIARQIRFIATSLNYDDLLRMKVQTAEKRVLVNENIRPIRPYIGAFIAKGIPVSEQFLIQMIQTQEKLCDGYGKKRELIAIGIYNADKIRFPVHYKAIVPDGIRFVPLDYDALMNLTEILEQHPKGMEFRPILEGFDQYPILVDDTGDVLSFPPVINSRTSGEVLVGDQHLFIEITGLDLDMTLHAVNILAYNFKDRGFEIEPVLSVYPYTTKYGTEVVSPYPQSNAVTVEKRLVEQYAGISYSSKDMISAFHRYGLFVEQKPESESLKVSTYPYRQDYMHPVDAVEDFTIAVGYNSFEPIMPERFTVGHLAPLTIFEDSVRDTMIGFGFEEVILNVLSNQEDFDPKVQGMFADILEISNPMAESYSVLRNSLLPSLLKVEAKSSKSVYPHKVFEVGEVVVRDNTENHGYTTRTRIAAMLAHAEANFSEMGSYLAHLGYLMFWDFTVKAASYPLFIPGRSGEIRADDAPVGIIGEVHPQILETWGIKMPTVMFELDLSSLFVM